MISHSRSIRVLMFAIVVSSMTLSTLAYSDTVLRFNFGDTAFAGDVNASGLIFRTTDDENLTKFGDQTSNLSYTGFLDSSYTDIQSGASVSIANLAYAGDAVSGGANSVYQATQGGQFNLYSDSNELVLAGDFGSGLISGGVSSPTASFYSTSPVVFTGGTLLPRLDADSGTFTLALNTVQTGGSPGLQIINDTLQNFSADATGQISASQSVPEPCVFPVLISAALVLSSRRRRTPA